jgi:hypothetical protein
MCKRLSNDYIHQHGQYLFGKLNLNLIINFFFFSRDRNLIPIQRQVLEAIQDELSYGKGREITTINAIYDRLGKNH